MQSGWLARAIEALPAIPSSCAVCGAWPTQPVCAGCVARFASTHSRCRSCALPIPDGVATCGACLRHPPPLDACHAAVSYAYPWSELIARFKFRGEPGWDRTFAALLHRTAGVSEALSRADLVLPMPLAPERLAERGFNQALLLARALGSRSDAGLLLRLRATAPQASLSRRQREANVEGAFGIEPLRAGELRGKRVLLVDDVMTSGSSLFAAARAARQAGATEVAAIVFARTDEPPH